MKLDTLKLAMSLVTLHFPVKKFKFQSSYVPLFKDGARTWS